MITYAIVGIIFMVVLSVFLAYMVDSIKTLHLLVQDEHSEQTKQLAISLWRLLEEIEHCAERNATDTLQKDILVLTANRWVFHSLVEHLPTGDSTVIHMDQGRAVPVTYEEDCARGLQEVSHAAALKLLNDGTYAVCGRDIATSFCPVRQQDIEYTLYMRPVPCKNL